MLGRSWGGGGGDGDGRRHQGDGDDGLPCLGEGSVPITLSDGTLVYVRRFPPPTPNARGDRGGGGGGGGTADAGKGGGDPGGEEGCLLGVPTTEPV